MHTPITKEIAEQARNDGRKKHIFLGRVSLIDKKMLYCAFQNVNNYF